MIFVDQTGNRRRALAVLGICVGLILAAGLVALSLVALTDHPVRQAPWPEPAAGAAG
jgi:hypothetical protein